MSKRRKAGQSRGRESAASSAGLDPTTITNRIAEDSQELIRLCDEETRLHQDAIRLMNAARKKFSERPNQRELSAHFELTVQMLLKTKELGPEFVAIGERIDGLQTDLASNVTQARRAGLLDPGSPLIGHIDMMQETINDRSQRKFAMSKAFWGTNGRLEAVAESYFQFLRHERAWHTTGARRGTRFADPSTTLERLAPIMQPPDLTPPTFEMGM